MWHLKLNFVIILYLCSLNVFTEAGTRKWPSRFPRCFRDDPNLNKCIVIAAHKMRPFLKAGIPELNIPPISPFLVPEVMIQQGTDSVNMKVLLKDLIITGFDTYQFEKFDFDVQNMRFDSALELGNLKIETDYSLEGKILTVPIKGQGKLTALITSSNGTLTQNFTAVTRKGKQYLESKDLEIKIDVRKIGDYKFDGLFDGNEVLAKTVHNLIKENEKDLIEELKPAVEKIIAEIILDIQRKSFGGIPYDELFPISKSN